MAADILKLSVLADNRVLLEGEPVELDELAARLDAAPPGTAVWYYRENAGGEPPPAAAEVMKLVVRRRLPVRLSTKPDFSDSVTPDPFEAIRKKAAEGQIVVLRPDGKALAIAAPAKERAPVGAVAAVERLLPSTTRRNVAIVAGTGWSMAEKPDLPGAAREIPFFGLVMGLSSIGHSVWIFDGVKASVALGCRAADVLIVDSARSESLQPEWQKIAAQVMRGREILVHDRATNQLRRVAT